ncbi:MAG: transcriptional regulator [Candidatus Omnitrophica bacterium]|nr:transcriptional regulator [Candidatus Omnitrophota bacterium]
MNSRTESLSDFFRKKNGIVSYAEVLEAGFNKTNLKDLLDSGVVQKVDRALYRLAEGKALSNPDLVTVTIKCPKAVVCLISALSFHEATDEIPHAVDLAIRRGDYANKIGYPPVRYYFFSAKTWEAGIEEHILEGRKVRIYSLAKTLADCFKFRNKIGADVARQALKIGLKEKRVSPNEIMRYAKICRVGNVIKPVLESLL